jgi:predicted hotdog family 3-hydroxylacyl-ACP dehydratase
METPNKVLERDFVEQLLPQKFPFVMVDKMFSYTENEIVAGLKIQEDNIFFHEGKLVESGLIEHMAQSVALHTGYEYFLKQEIAPTGYIGSIKNLEIKELPKLNDEIKTTVTIIQRFGGITLVEIVTTIQDIKIAFGQMKTVLAK